MSDYVCRYCRNHFEFQLISLHDKFKFCSSECEKAFKEEEERENRLKEELKAEIRETSRVESNYQRQDSRSEPNRIEHNDIIGGGGYVYTPPPLTDREKREKIYGALFWDNVPLLAVAIGIIFYIIGKSGQSIWMFFSATKIGFILSGIVFVLMPGIGELTTPWIGTILVCGLPLLWVAPKEIYREPFVYIPIIFLMSQIGWTLQHYLSLTNSYKIHNSKVSPIRIIEIHGTIRWILHSITIPIFIVATMKFNGVIFMGFIFAVFYWLIQYYIASNFLE
jgi:hypothetical protein